MKYPTAPRTDLIDILHGVAVPDPFRRLESADDAATAAWVAEENALTRGLLDSPLRDGLAARLRELHRVPRMSVPSVRGDRIFYTENDGTRAQAVLYVGTGDLGLGAQSADPGLGTGDWGLEARVLVDPNGLSDDGTTAITVFEPDNAGDRVVYGLSRHGSDVQELLMHDVASGTTLIDRLAWVKFASIAWHGDGFFYTRYPQPGTVPADQENYFCQVWYHRAGEPQAGDRLVYHRPDAPEVVFEVHVTSDDRHLVIGSYQGASDHAEIHVVRLPPSPPGGFGGTRKPDTADLSGGWELGTGGSKAPGGADTRAVVTGFNAGWHFIDGRDGMLYFRTDAGAPFGRIVRFDLREAELDAHVVVPESTDTIVDATVAAGRLLVNSLRSASSRLTSWSLDGADERAIALPDLGTINGLGARWTDARSFATFTSFTTPAAIMACAADALVPIRQTALPFDPQEYVTEQVWYPSKDGTPISMFLVSKRGINGTACLLTGYGGFNVSLTPSFAPSDFLWLDAGGVLAMANLRGGGEYGDAWHRAGMRDQKQRVFDDFIAGAEWLQSTGRAARGRLAIEGASNGGLLAGACLVQRPDLFGAVVCRVPVADMLRYHLFTVGRFWIPEYGCADQAADFPFLLRYSPYHNVIDGTAYPPTLVMTADTDDRVAPGMAKKFAARLQEATSSGGGPIVLRVETRAGHGAGKPIEKQVDEQADLYAFLFQYLTGKSASEQM